ncbi:glycosyltransferase family 2 protein [Halomonas denitrificans]|nr:glycosyltransferase family 2 protein [Halomonas denitrificans]
MADEALSLRDALRRVGVLIVNYNAGPWLERGARRLAEGHGAALEIVIVDNGSTDDSLAGLSGPNLRIDRAKANLGFGPGMNRAARLTERELLLLLNPDAAISHDDLGRLVRELDAHPESVLVSGRVIDDAGREQRGSRRRAPTAGRVLAELLPGASGRGIDLTGTPAPDRPTELDAVSGACMLVRAAAFRAVGGFDEGYPLHFEDLDLFARLRAAGGRLRWVPDVTIRHVGGVSSRGRSLHVMRSKHRGLMRYIRQHIATGASAWQRPFWWLALTGSRLLRTPFAALRDRRFRPEAA